MGHQSRLREAVADPADDEGLPALGPSDGPPESPSQVTDLCFWNSIVFVTISLEPPLISTAAAFRLPTS